MSSYLLKRLLWGLLTLLLVSALAYTVAYHIADPAAAIAGNNARPEDIAKIRARLGLDRPLPVQYADFLKHTAGGDLGQSYVSQKPVTELIAARLPATALLAVCGWLSWVLLGTLAGVWASARRSAARENALLLFSTVGISTPTFWVGILLLLIFVSRLQWFPAGGSGTPAHLVLPVIALAVTGIAYYARLAHSSITDTLREDYIRTAVAKGVPPGAVLFRHALRNALLPLVSVAGTDLAALLGGVVFTETVFDWPGMGKLAVEAVGTVDIPVIVGVVLVSAAFVVMANLVVDLLYPLLDPRIRLL